MPIITISAVNLFMGLGFIGVIARTISTVYRSVYSTADLGFITRLSTTHHNMGFTVRALLIPQQ